VAATLPTAAHARQQTRDTAVVRLDSLNVNVLRRPGTAANSPVAATVIAGPRIQVGQLTVGLDESLVAVPGLLVNNRYNPSLGSRIAIRGFGARAAFGVRGIRLIADGIPLTMPDGQSNLNNLDLGSAGRIEVIRGPASALHGNAAGGVISIESEAPPPEPFSLHARAITSDLDADEFTNLRKLQVKLAGRSARTDYLASVARQEVDGYRAYSASRLTQLNLVGHYALDPSSRLTLVVNGVDQPVAESPGALPFDSVQRDRRMAWPNNVRTGAGEATSQAQVGVGYGRWSERGRFDVSIYGLMRSVDNAIPAAFIDLNRRAGGVRAAYTTQLDVAGRALGITAGTDVELQSDDRVEFDNVGGQPGSTLRRDQVDGVSAIGPFAQAFLDLFDQVSVSLGARYDAVRFRTTDEFLGDGRDDSGKRTLTAFSPVGGVIFAPTARTSVYANVATSFQTPTTTELINAPPAPGQACCPAGFNSQLEPQRALSFETGVRGEFGGIARYDAAVYHMKVRNALIPFQVPQADAREFFRNAGESRHRGIETSLTAAWDRVTVTGAYTFSDFVFVDDGIATSNFEGNRIPGVPKHHVFLGGRVVAGRGLALEADVDHVGEYFTNDANDAAAINPSATVLDLRVLFDVSVGRFEVSPFVALNNVANEHYNSSVVVNGFGGRFFEPAPGRNLAIGLSAGVGGWSR
jgi:iron complex outermembrane receptor protein